MERVGILIALVALAISIFPEPTVSTHQTVLFWFAMVCLIWGGVALLRSYMNVKVAGRLLGGYLSLWAVLEGAKETTNLSEEALLDRVITLARSGQIRLYGERGGARKLSVIPLPYLRTHDLLWDDRSVGTIDPKTPLGDQDTDDLFFNLHSDKSLMKKITAGTRAARRG